MDWHEHHSRDAAQGTFLLVTRRSIARVDAGTQGVWMANMLGTAGHLLCRCAFPSSIAAQRWAEEQVQPRQRKERTGNE